jgi:transposase
LGDGVGPVRGRPGRPRLGAERLIADRGYDHDKYRRALRARGVEPIIVRRATEHGFSLGKLRWVVERSFSRLHQSNGCVSAGNAAPSCTRRSCTSRAPAFAGGSCAPCEA